MEAGLAAQGLPAWRGGACRLALPTRRGGSAWCERRSAIGWRRSARSAARRIHVFGAVAACRLANPRRRHSARSAARRIYVAGKAPGALAFRSTPISGARSLSFAVPVPRLPIFWVLLQKMGPKFDIIPELLGGFRGTISCRMFLTWGNAFIEGRFSLFSPAKPPRSSDGPIAAA